MNDAVQAMFIALERGDAIVIHGDYDADGVSGSSLLFFAISDIAQALSYVLNLDVFLPDRERDGYGVAMHTVERFITEGKRLLVTVDCGIANGRELQCAHDSNIPVIVCDHHQMGVHFPEHAMVLHPLAPGEVYPNKTLCGTGVAFKFASALIDEARKRGANFPEGYEKWFLDLVAIATVTDVMPLVGENRVLEAFGLKVLNKTRRPGLRAILAASGTELGAVDTQAIGFRIGPRLNAAGRLSSARIAFDTIVARDYEDAERRAAALEQLNRDRQTIFRTSYCEAEAMARDMADCTVLVVVSESWLPGIVGLIAGRLVHDFGKPAFAFTRVGDTYVGSGRTAGGLHLVDVMNACGDLFVRKGGHPQACGLTIATMEMVDRFRVTVNDVARTMCGSDGPTVSLMIDARCNPSTLSVEAIALLQTCAPFGEGNRAPVFACLNATVIAVETMGSGGAHLRLTVREDEGAVVKCVGFSMGERAKEFLPGLRIDLAYEPGINVWNGRREVQVRMIESRTSQRERGI
jgi:single-stranded-DNA-specific exonuclease